MPQKELKVPSSRTSRATKLGGIFARVAGNLAYQGTKQLLQGNKPKMSELVLAPSNITQLAEKLAAMRGAAMKLGQLLSMDAGELLPQELSDILAKLRDQAHAMPHKQLVGSLKANWGENWVDHFAYFNLTPFACASIGQVHIANDDNGTKLAVKLQYPGVRDAIESDVNNLGLLIKVSGLLPKHIGIDTLLEETKKQLLVEADYQQEAAFIALFTNSLDNDSFVLPRVNSLSNKNILVMSFIDGQSIETMTYLSQLKRDNIVTRLFELFFLELFDLKLMQTDPNFANYLYDVSNDKIGLLDFGATRVISNALSESYLQLFRALINQNNDDVIKAAKTIGFFKHDIEANYLNQIIDLFNIASTPLRLQDDYDFDTCTIAEQLSSYAQTINRQKDQWHTPPVDALFIHRKIAGLYLIAKKLKAKINVNSLFSNYL